MIIQEILKEILKGIMIISEFLRNHNYSGKSSYRLDVIGKDEVGLGKIEYEGTLNDLYESDINKFIEYNLNDVKIVKALMIS